MKVVKVKFKESGEEYYFSSYAAIYEKFSSIDIGAVIGSIYNKIKTANVYENNKVTIKCYPLKTKKRRN